MTPISRSHRPKTGAERSHSSPLLPSPVCVGLLLLVAACLSVATLSALDVDLSRLIRHIPSQSTLYFHLGSETDCADRFNYVCKFWYSVRCHLLRLFPSVVLIAPSDPDNSIDKLVKVLQPRDTVLFPSRLTDHDRLPPEAEKLLSLRSAARRWAPLRSVRVGLFHLANEWDRRNFPWYRNVDFVARNYWLEFPPKHVLYVPLPAQYPFGCTPNTLPSFPSSNSSSASSSWLVTSSITTDTTCSCSRQADPTVNASYTPASQRKYLWSFSGSLRKNRGYFIDRLRADMELAGLGEERVANDFGGDGDFGTSNPKTHPKTEYLQLIADSAFVFSPCGNVIETHRIYEAVALRAIPVIENCNPYESQFFPFRRLVLGNDDVEDETAENSHTMMRDFVKGFLKEVEEGGEKRRRRKEQGMDLLQKEMLQWWHQYIKDLGRNMSNLVHTVVPSEEREAI